MSILPVCRSVCQMHAWYPRRPEEGVREPGTGLTGGCDLPCGCWELNMGPLEEQSVFLTNEPSELTTKRRGLCIRDLAWWCKHFSRETGAGLGVQGHP